MEDRGRLGTRWTERGCRWPRPGARVVVAAFLLLALYPGCDASPSWGVLAAQVAGSSQGPSAAPDDGAEADFMRAMIQHHLQALEMTTLAAERSRNRDVLLLAQRIAISQDDEIEVMRQWLERRGEKQPEARDTPNGIAPHQVHEAPQAGRSETLPHGMLTREQLTSLEDASAEDFDRLFLELMIQHHEGALLMVEEFFRQGGGGRDAETFEIASHVDSDQRVEIARMRRVLAELD